MSSYGEHLLPPVHEDTLDSEYTDTDTYSPPPFVRSSSSVFFHSPDHLSVGGVSSHSGSGSGSKEVGQSASSEDRICREQSGLIVGGERDHLIFELHQGSGKSEGSKEVSSSCCFSFLEEAKSVLIPVLRSQKAKGFS